MGSPSWSGSRSLGITVAPIPAPEQAMGGVVQNGLRRGELVLREARVVRAGRGSMAGGTPGQPGHTGRRGRSESYPLPSSSDGHPDMRSSSGFRPRERRDADRGGRSGSRRPGRVRQPCGSLRAEPWGQTEFQVNLKLGPRPDPSRRKSREPPPHRSLEGKRNRHFGPDKVAVLHEWSRKGRSLGCCLRSAALQHWP